MSAHSSEEVEEEEKGRCTDMISFVWICNDLNVDSEKEHFQNHESL